MVIRGIIMCLLSMGWALLPAQQTVWMTTIDSVSLFASPGAVDLTGDGILDIVIGGGIEGYPHRSGVNALDGSDGSRLWSHFARDQIFGTPLFKDITGDGVPDVFIGGRTAVFFALNGANGQLIWEFWSNPQGDPAPQGWFQFYNPQWIPDQDQDGVDDLLISNGGDPSQFSFDTIRPPGRLMVFSGLTGNLLADVFLPDGHETYFSPLLYGDSSDPQVLFGSGGETVRGKLWRAPLTDVMQSDLSNAVLLLNDTLKGFVPVPSLADLNQDGLEDLIVPSLSGKLTAIDGDDDQILWQLDFPGYENYVSPTIGQFTGDPTPDVFAIIALGQWSFYAAYVQLMVDGATGQVVWTDTSSVYQMTQPNAMDWDGDGFDEVLLQFNYDIGSSTVIYQNRLEVINFQTGQTTQFGGPRSGLNLFSTPLLTDLDGDQSLEMVLAQHADDGFWNGSIGTTIEVVALNRYANPVAWGGFMGNLRDGRYLGVPVTERPEATTKSLQLGPNPTIGPVRLLGGKAEEVQVFDLQGRKLLHRERVDSLDLSGFPKGTYLVHIVRGKDHFRGKIILI